MSKLDHALALAARGFWVFPVVPGDKVPAVKDWPNEATRNVEQIQQWWSDRDYNIGISTSRYQDDKALLVVDVDNKGAKHGDSRIFELELEGSYFPGSFEQSTPSGGRHIIYRTDLPVRQGVDVLGAGLDIRSRGGYIVGPGSEIGGKPYAQINGHGTLADAPGWLVSRLGVADSRPVADRAPLPGVDVDRAQARAIDYLRSAPLATEGAGGDDATYRVAAKLKDLGCSQGQAEDLMAEHWNPRCSPPWDGDELADKVKHAFKYGRLPPGSHAPEAVFAAVATPAPAPEESGAPLDVMNRDLAFIRKGAFVLQETTDQDGNPSVEHLNMAEFHGWYANKTMSVGKKTQPLSQWWLEWTGRREYEAVVFEPQRTVGARWYNMWRGFTVEPATTGSHPSVEAFKEHALKNVCGNDPKLCHWLMSFFAHMIQRPFEKPLVALVFKGRKGTGKNALVERVGALLGAHFMVADDDRYLLSNFNAHLEACLFLTLDEASWAGDKRAEGRLKGVITGSHHTIERKGRETYKVKNLTRVAILGNEDWLVPATEDERRYAVFNVGDGRRQDRAFFHNMRVGMERGGYAHLLRYLLDYDTTGADVNDAPNTLGLLEQKLASLGPTAEWWHACLSTGEIAGGDFAGEWPDRIPSNRLLDALERWTKKRNVRSWLPTANKLRKFLTEVAPTFEYKKARPGQPGDKTYSFFTPGLDQLRQEFDTYIGGTLPWSDV